LDFLPAFLTKEEKKRLSVDARWNEGTGQLRLQFDSSWFQEAFAQGGLGACIEFDVRRARLKPCPSTGFSAPMLVSIG
jgi:hypothetical protein